MQQVTRLPNPPIAVNDTLPGFTVAEFMVFVGQTRAMVSVPENGNRYATGLMVEWVTSLSLAPQTAKHLCRQLQDSVEQYERKFGEIQHDPAAEPGEGASVTRLQLVPTDQQAQVASVVPVEPPPPAA